MTHFLYCPLTGLGLYGGYRGDRWLKNRIKVMKAFVIPSLLAQTSKNFTLWVSVRKQERTNKQVTELKEYLDSVGIDNVFTYSGLCFWDDKFPDKEARERLGLSLHGALVELVNKIDSEEVLMTIQPSDDCYAIWMVERVQKFFKELDYQAIGFSKGYICDYLTMNLGEYNPQTNPPFFTIRFSKDIFVDPVKHMDYTGPYHSHEYVPDFLKYKTWDWRGFIVGCHGENTSTYYDHPYRGNDVDPCVLEEFGISRNPIKINRGWRRRAFHSLPHAWQRKLRYWLGERFYAKLYNLFVL